jgi:glutaredoxin
VGCERKAEPHDSAPAPAGEPSRGDALPPLELRDDTPGALITWVDQEGEFRVAQRPEQVPAEARGTVRVVLQNQPAGTPESVYVADLTRKAPDGTYPVRTLPRAEWDALGSERRQARIAKLAPPVAAVPPGGSPVVIYGADWCKPCHLAEDYLRERKVPVVLKDIEEDPAARDEMKTKLSAANLRDASIPVIDVGGTLLVGFSPRALDAAIAKLPPAQPPSEKPPASQPPAPPAQQPPARPGTEQGSAPPSVEGGPPAAP